MSHDLTPAKRLNINYKITIIVISSVIFDILRAKHSKHQIEEQLRLSLQSHEKTTFFLLQVQILGNRTALGRTRLSIYSPLRQPIYRQRSRFETTAFRPDRLEDSI